MGDSVQYLVPTGAGGRDTVSRRSMANFIALNPRPLMTWISLVLILISYVVVVDYGLAAAQTGVDVSFPFPAQLPFPSGMVVAVNGPHNKHGEAHPWAYVDFGSSGQSDVVAMASGTISEISNCGDGGQQILVDHPQGWRSEYYHLASVAEFEQSGRQLRPGDHVELGTAVGTISDDISCGDKNLLQLGIFRDQTGSGVYEPVDIRSMKLGGYTVTSQGYPAGGVWTRDADGAVVAKDDLCPGGVDGCVTGTIEVLGPRLDQASQDPDLGKVSTVLILDSTGSMVWNDPPVPAARGEDHGLRLQAAESFVRNALPGDEIGVVDFDTTATVVSPVVNVGGYGSETRAAIGRTISEIDASGSTNLSTGLQSGCDVLNSQATHKHRTAIFFTDGIGDTPIESTECFRRSGWKVFTIGLSNEVDEAMLRWIAQTTGGTYRFLDPGGDRFDVCSFLQIRAEVLGQPAQSCAAANVIAQDQTITHTHEVGDDLLQISYVANWPQGDIVMTATSPSGRVISRNSRSGDSVSDVGPTYEITTVHTPEPGTWTVTLFGSDIPGGRQPYSFTTSEIVAPKVEPGPQLTVRARGSTGDERFEIRSNGSVVSGFRASTEYVDYVVSLPKGTTLPDIEVVFVNDALGPGYDRNLQVDYIELDGQRHETEADSTFGTGTYLSSSPCQPGFVGSDKLHCNGYFRYAQPVADGTSLLIRARGQTGDERFEIRVGGQSIAGFEVTTVAAGYRVSVPKGTTVADIQVAFVNDARRGSYDRNLIVDYIEFNGARYESESETTFGTGTYRNNSRCRPGYLKSEALHCNGYLQYA